MPSVGAQLKQARQDRRISVADVTRATKIQPWVLDALEADQLHTTMSPVYVKSFLSAYAKFLRVDPQPMIAQLFPAPPPSEESAGAAASAPAGFALPLEALRDGLGLVLRRLIPVAVAAGAVALIVAAKPLRWLPSLRVTQASFSAPAKASSAQPAAPALKPAQALELGIVARRSSWISVKADGDLVAQQKLSPGAKESWKARRRIELVIGNPAQVDVLLNGQSISPLAIAHDGRLLITHKGVTPLEE